MRGSGVGRRDVVPRLLPLRVVRLHAVEGTLGVGAVLHVRLVLGVLRVLQVLGVLLRVLRQGGLLRTPRRLARALLGLGLGLGFGD